MELVDVLESLEELIFEKEIRNNKEGEAINKEYHKLYDELRSAIEEIENEKLREKLYYLFDDYSSIQGSLIDFTGSYSYEKGAMIGQAFQYLKGDLGFNK